MKKCIMKLISFLLRNKKRERQSRIKKCNPTEQVNRFLQTGYAFRYNRLTEETEYRPIGIADKAFLRLAKGNEFLMSRSPCPGHPMLGQRYQPLSFFQIRTGISSFPALL